MRETLTQLRLRLKAMLRQRQLDRDLDDEMAFHLAMREQANREAGLTADEARVSARKRFGSQARVKESLREMWQWGSLDRAWQDIRFAWRGARRQPGFSLVVILTLALGIGASTAMFSIVDAVVLRPIAFAEPDRLVALWETNRERNINRFVGSVANYTDWQKAKAFAELGAFVSRDDNRTDGAQPEKIAGAVASSALFRALGVQPVIGRFFRSDEDRPANRFVAVLGFEYWQRAFNGDRAVVGRGVVINGESYTIVGVMPAQRPWIRHDIWRPLAPDVAALDRGDHDAIVVGRLAPGASIAQAEAEVQTIAARLAAAYPRTNKGWSVRAEPLADAILVGSTRRAMIILMGAVGLLLLIACVNVANLMLARAAGRRREMSTRLALGAARGRVVRQLLTESAVLACAGGVAGLFVAVWGLRLVQWLFPADIPGLIDAAIDPYALAFAAAASLLTTVLVGLAPALQLSRLSLEGGLRASTRGTTDAPQTRRLRQTLVVAEIALALVLLIGAGLLIRSVDRLKGAPLGFQPEQVLTGKIGLYGEKENSLTAYLTFVEALLEDLKGRPGIGSVGVSSSVPFGGGYTSMRAVPDAGGSGSAALEGVQTAWRVIGGDYFAAVGIPLRAGRLFERADDRERATRATRVTIINDALAQRLWPGQNPIGRRILVGDSRRPYEIIGVVGQAQLTTLGREPEPVMYYHYRQFPWTSLTIAIRAQGDPLSLERTVRSSVSSLDPRLPLFDVRTLDDLVNRAAATPQMNAALLALFAALALTLSAIGVYGVMSYSTAQRTGEIALRLALGAQPRDMLNLVWRHGLTLTVLGLALGFAAALAAGRALSALLFEVSALDPTTYATGLALMLAVALLASYLPAHRAMRTDPVLALRQE
jgi:putative ABC transport system permease protein